MSKRTITICDLCEGVYSDTEPRPASLDPGDGCIAFEFVCAVCSDQLSKAIDAVIESRQGLMRFTPLEDKLAEAQPVPDNLLK